MSDSMPPSNYNNEHPRWYDQPQASYPGNGAPPPRPQQPQPYYEGAPVQPNPGQSYPGQAIHQQQPGYGANTPYVGQGINPQANPYASQQGMYQQQQINPYASQQGMYQQPGAIYTTTYGMDPYSGKALAGMILGIIAIVIWLIPFVGQISAIICGIIGIVLSAQGRQSPTRGGMATVGLVLSILAVIFVPLLLICTLGAGFLI